MTNEFKMEYGITGEARKRLVKAVAEFKETFSEYCGAPTFAYTVEDITIDKAGDLIFSEDPGEVELAELTEFLESKGFILGGSEEEEIAEEAAESTADAETSESNDTSGPEDDIITIEMPKNGFTEVSLANLQKIIESKASLLKKSLGADDLTIGVTDDRIRFPWFRNEDPMSIQAYTKLVAAICKAAKEAKRVTATDREVDSEKYAFRTWLLRLGFIGSEYKNDRAILMRNLSGTAAFKNQADADAFSEKLKAKRDAARGNTEGNDVQDGVETVRSGAE